MPKFADLSFKDDVRHYLLSQERDVHLTIGRKSYVGSSYVREDTSNVHVFIGNFCSISNDISFMTGANHVYDGLTAYPLGLLFGFNSDCNSGDFQATERNFNRGYIFIGNNVWIGQGVSILDGVRIGNGCIIGAGAVVAKDVPPNSIVVGNPARVIRSTMPEEQWQKVNRIKWWYWQGQLIKENEQYFRNPSVDGFVDAFYKPELEMRVESDFSKQLQGFRADGFKVVYYEPDFSDTFRKYNGHIIDQHVIADFFRVANDKQLLLVLKMSSEDVKKYSAVVQEFYSELSNQYGYRPKLLIKIADTPVAMDILQNVDFVVLNHRSSCMFAVDFACDYGAKILSGFAQFVF